MNHYIHNVPGRLRIKNPLFKNPSVQDEIKRQLSTLVGIGTVEFNDVTGSALIFYNPRQINSGDVVSLFQRMGYFDPSNAVTSDHYIHNGASKVGKIVGKAVLGAFVEKALEGSALSILALLI